MEAMQRVNNIFKSVQHLEQNQSRKPSHDIPSTTSAHVRNKKSVAVSQGHQDNVRYLLYHHISLLDRVSFEFIFRSSESVIY